MIIEKLQMPFILATGHPLSHFACFLTSLVFILTSGRDTFSDWRKIN